MSSGKADRRTLREWRETRYMDQQEFAGFLGISVFTLRAWEQERHAPRIKQKREIAEKLGIHPDQIVWPDQKNLAA